MEGPWRAAEAWHCESQERPLVRVQPQKHRVQGQEESQEAWSEDEIQAKRRRWCLGDGSG